MRSPWGIRESGVTVLCTAALALLTGCETGGYWNVSGTGKQTTYQGAYWGTSPGGTTVGGSGTAIQKDGEVTTPGVYIWVNIPWGGGSGSKWARTKVNYIYPNREDIDGETHEIH